MACVLLASSVATAGDVDVVYGRVTSRGVPTLHVEPVRVGDVELATDASGAVTHARATRSTVPDANVVQCIVHAFGAVVFPRMRSAMIVRYPIELRPEG